LFLWLLFRLMVGSGVVKLASGDPTWHNLTALSFHFETQPIPTPVAWYAAHLPTWLLKFFTAVTLAVEIGAPFLIPTTPRLRDLAFLLLAGLQFVIALTGNYTFFNVLSAGLCLFLLDDVSLGRRTGHDISEVSPSQWRHVVGIGVALITVPLSAAAFAGSLG